MSGILNKLGLGHDSNSSASSSSSSSTTSSSTHSSVSGTSATHGTNMAGSTYSSTSANMAGSNVAGSTINRTGYADTGAYAHTAGAGYTASTTTTTTTATAPAMVENNAGYMTRSEERLLVGKEQVAAGVASLNKYVTTEHVSTAVPITKEHVVIEREPIAPGDAIRGDIKEAHYEVALTEERAVAAKEAVAVEKVKLRKEVEHAVQNVDADLRKEHIEFGTTNETGKVLGAAPGTAGYETTGYSKTTTTTGSNYPAGTTNPRV